jgi:N-succinyldiaminopimelate aminotransferase
MLLGNDGDLKTTIFAEMSALAAATGAINLGQGFPDEDPPAEVLEAAHAALAGGLNQYPPGRGMPVLLEAIAEHQRRFYGITVDPATEVLVTVGATEALAATILALTEPGDEIVTFEPFYDSYAAVIGLSGARHVPVPLLPPTFQPDPDDLRRAVTDRTRIILINNPHNPTGSVFDRATLELIVELAHTHNAIIVSDEVYEHLTFGVAHTPVASLPGAAERTVTISSGGKTFNATGWKVGWLIAPAELVSAIQAVKQFLTYVGAAPFQPAIAAGLALPDSYFTTAAATLAAKRDILSAGLVTAGFDVTTPLGSYFIVADAAPLGVTDAADFCRRLPALAGVVGIPITAFVREDARVPYRSLVRFAFCKRIPVLTMASTQLASLSV